MRALIIGGAGGMGQGVARDLIKQKQVTHIILADLYPDEKRLSKKLRESVKSTLIQMDVNDHDHMLNVFKKSLPAETLFQPLPIINSKVLQLLKGWIIISCHSVIV